MVGIEALDVLERAQLDTPQFHAVDHNKRSRFNGGDLIKLMRIVTRRKTYGAPHGKGEEEWQAVADELNDAVGATFSFRACRDKVAALVKEHKRASAASRRASGVAEKHTGLNDLFEGYLQLKTRFDEQQQATKEKNNRKMKRLASAGNKAMRKAAAMLKRRKTGSGHRTLQPPLQESDEEDCKTQDRAAANQRVAIDDHSRLRELLGSDYSSEEETKTENNEEDNDTEELDDEEDCDDDESDKVGRKHLRVSKIWAKEEEMMSREREAQAARDRNLTQVVESLANQTKLLLDYFVRAAANQH